MRKSDRKKIAAMIIIMIVCTLAVLVFVFYINSKGKSAPKTLDSTAANQSADGAGGKSEKQFDENNIGELYYSPIDEEHIAEDESGVMYSDNEILLVSNDGVSKSDIEALAEKYGAEIVGWIEQTGDYQLKFSEAYTLEELDKLAEDIQSEDVVYSAYANYICEMSEDNVIDYDIHTGDKWTKNFMVGAIGILSKDTMWGAKAINAPQAWYAMNLLKDNIEPVKVGLIDGGFDTNHEDLGFAEVFYDDGVNNNEERNIVTDATTEEMQHGTHVAGTMAARGDNEEGICGIYPYGNGRLYGVAGSGIKKYPENPKFYESVMTYKISYAELVLRNVKVINQSQGFNWSTYWDDYYHLLFDTEKSWNEYQRELYNDGDFQQHYRKSADTLKDFLNRMLDKGYDFVIVCSAGNNSNNTIGNIESKYNSWITLIEDDEDRSETKTNHDVFDRIIVVGSIDSNCNISNFSDAGNRVDIFAPGDNIYSTLPDNKYGTKQGTSMASPHVAGVCADVWSMNKYLTGAEVKEIVCGSTLDDVVVYTTPNGESRGVVDANKAVAEAYNRLATSGRVIKEPENGAILCWVVEKDNEDEKIKKADVTAVSESGGSEEYTAETDEYGHFELILPKGDYTITVKAKGYKDYTFDVKLANNGEVVYPDWVKMEKKLTKAEKYAKIVMDNEDLWLKPMNKISSYNGTNYCWFEDLDFDGELEFVVGGSNWSDTDGWLPSTNRYYIYKFTSNGKMKLMKGNYDSSCDFTAFYANHNYSSRSAKSGFSDIGMELLYDNSSNSYKRVYITEASGGDYYGLMEVSIDSDSVGENSIAGFDAMQGTLDQSEYKRIKKEADSFNKNKVHCDLSVFSIPCTNTSRDIESDGIKCYDDLNDSKKRSALIKSYKTYEVTKTDSDSKVVKKFLSKLKGLKGIDKSAIKEQYKNIIDQKISEVSAKDPDMYSIEYVLFDIDKNKIPELVINFGTSYADHTISVYSFDAGSGNAYLVKDGISGFHVSFCRDIDKDQLAAAGGVTGAGFLTKFNMSDGILTTEEKSFDMYTESLDDFGNFVSVGLSYYSSFGEESYYREGYTNVGLYDLIDEYNY